MMLPFSLRGLQSAFTTGHLQKYVMYGDLSVPFLTAAKLKAVLQDR